MDLAWPDAGSRWVRGGKRGADLGRIGLASTVVGRIAGRPPAALGVNASGQVHPFAWWRKKLLEFVRTSGVWGNRRTRLPPFRGLKALIVGGRFWAETAGYAVASLKVAQSA